MEALGDIDSNARLLIALGSILLLGLLASFVGKRTFLPRVTLLLLFGVVIGQHGFDVIPSPLADNFDEIAQIALLMVGFLLGGKLTRRSLDGLMWTALGISLVTALVTAVLVSLGLMLIGVDVVVAVLLGCIAAATAPAAVLDIVTETGAGGRFKDLLLSIVALDDAWALMLFGIGIAIAFPLYDESFNNGPFLMTLKHIGGAICLGFLIGVPATYLTGRLKPGKPSMTEALGVVFLCGGVALWFDVSYLIAVMVLGSTIANLAQHHDYPFHAIEGIEDQFMMLFFVLAGASLEVNLLLQIGTIGLAYISLRVLGKLSGAWIGGFLVKTDPVTRNWMGVAMLPQAGVAIGMALVAGSYFPEHRDLLLPLVISATVLFELVGPLFTRLALDRAEQSRQEWTGSE